MSRAASSTPANGQVWWFMFLGAAAGGNAARSSISRELLLFLCFALAVLAASFVLWDPLDVDERAHVRRLTDHAADSIRADLQADVQSLLVGQQLLAAWVAAREAPDSGQSDLGARFFLDLHPSYLLVRWADAALVPRWTKMQGAGPLLRPDDLEAQLQAVATAAARGGVEPVLSPAFQLTDGGAALAVAVPGMQGDRRVGYLLGIVHLRSALTQMLEDHTRLGWAVAILQGRTVVHQSDVPAEGQAGAAEYEGPLPIHGLSWRMRVWPKRDLVAEIRSPLPELAIVLGGILGLLLALAGQFGRAALGRLAEAKRARAEVERRVAKRTVQLRLANASLVDEVQERHRAEEQVRQVSGRLLRLQDDERRHIARELHDSTAQIIGSVAIKVDQAARLTSETLGTGRAAALLSECTEHLAQVSLEIRTLSFLLHPPMLDDLGLKYALPWYVKGFSERSGIEVALELPCEVCRMPSDVELALFRITQEALANVHRHSGSPDATLRMSCDEARVTLEIFDSGRGVSEEILSIAGAGQIGVGIAGMQERVRQLGGQLEIRGRDGGGTSVRVILPIDGPAGGCVRHSARGRLACSPVDCPPRGELACESRIPPIEPFVARAARRG